MERLDKLEANLRQDIKGLEETMSAMAVSLGSEVERLETKCQRLEQENSELWDKVDRLESFSRRSNVLFYNIPEEPRETWERCERKVRELVKGCMGMELSEMDIERAHRVGPPGNARRARKIVAKFWNYKNKAKIISNAKKFKDNGVDVTEDFTERVKNSRNKLKQHMMSARSQGHFAKLSYDKLVIDGRVFVPGEGDSLTLISKRGTLDARIVQPVDGANSRDGEDEFGAEGNMEVGSQVTKEDGKRKRDGNGKVSPNVKTLEKKSKVEMERGRSKLMGRKESSGRSASPSVRDFFKSQVKPKEG